MSKKSNQWPTKRLPPAPASVETHGDYINWSSGDKQRFHKWATSLKYYPPIKEQKQ